MDERVDKIRHQITLKFNADEQVGSGQLPVTYFRISYQNANPALAQKIAQSRPNPNRKKWLIFSLVLNFAILGVFKYFNFFVDSFAGSLDTLGFHHIPLPLIPA